MKITLLILTSLFLISCGKNSRFESPTDLISAYTAPTKGSVEEVLFTYELSAGGCTTGYHEFTSFEATCEALLNEDLNNSCAKDKRVSLYETSGCRA